jgi:hypothetical protein
MDQYCVKPHLTIKVGPHLFEQSSALLYLRSNIRNLKAATLEFEGVCSISIVTDNGNKIA